MIIKTSPFSPKLSTVTKKDVKIKYSRHSEQWNPICRLFQAKQDPHTSIIYRNQLFLRTKYRCKIGQYMHTKRSSTIISSSLVRQEQRITRRFRPWDCIEHNTKWCIEWLDASTQITLVEWLDTILRVLVYLSDNRSDKLIWGRPSSPSH